MSTIIIGVILVILVIGTAYYLIKNRGKCSENCNCACPVKKEVEKR